MDTLLNQIGFQLQHTKEPKSQDAPDNLFEAIPDNRIEGYFSDQAPQSYSTKMQINPTAKWGTVASILLGLGALALLTGAIDTNKF